MNRVLFFVTCVIDSLFPEIGEAAVAVLERQGVAVEFPETQICCGQPAYNAGYRPESRAVARQFIAAFEPWPDLPIVTPSGSCAAMLAHGYHDLFRDDPAMLARGEAVARRAYEFTQYLVDVLGVDDVGARWPGRLAYHAACHSLRGLGVLDAPLRLLRHVREAEVLPLPGFDECCGFGGLFSIKHGDISTAILERKLRGIGASGAETIVTGDASCLMHMNGGLSRAGAPQRVVHIAEVLNNR
jgi:L-lactate dehydrogenase complex protein LldE